MKIFLIGMPGSGKSTLGRQLANELSLPFVDLDHEIEQQEQSSIKDIFSEKGEDHFRQVESKALKFWCESSHEFVLATGGGAACFHNGIDFINKAGLSIFLDVPIRELVRRVEKNNDRPLLVSDNVDTRSEQLAIKLTMIRDKRLSCYTQASIRIESPTLKDVLQVIKK